MAFNIYIWKDRDMYAEKLNAAQRSECIFKRGLQHIHILLKA